MTHAAGWTRLERMLRARRFDEVLIQHVSLVRGVFHVGMGQEATAAAIATERAPEDVVMLNHRNHQHLAAAGSDLTAMFAEIFGRDHGPHRGRNGTLHLADAARGVPYTSAMVGGTVPLGLGMVLARRRRGEPGLAFCCFGDGALGEGLLHECLNLAKLWELPAVFVCESNASPGADRANRMQSAAALTDLPSAHRVPAEAVDATRPRLVHEAIQRSAAAARSGRGPQFVVAQTVPWPGNATFIPTLPDGRLDLARAAEPAAGWEAHDPILVEARDLLEGDASLAELQARDTAIQADVDEAVRAALAAPPAPAAAAFEHVWESA
jgi:TPP-dependent pyruvate/acetoin dehydrogenase alpha subunit